MPKSYPLTLILNSIGGSVLPPSADHARGTGPFVDGAGHTYSIRQIDNMLLVDGLLTPYYASLLLFEASHGTVGILYFKDLNGIWNYRDVSGMAVVYDEQGRDPQTDLPPVITPVPDHARGAGPIVDSQGRVYTIGTNNVVAIDGVNTGVSARALLFERAHRNGLGALYAKNLSTGRWRWYDPSDTATWPDYNPAALGRPGLVADNRDPETNVPAPADSANSTFAATVDFGGSTWALGTATFGNFIVLRDGVQFPIAAAQLAVNFLVFESTLYWTRANGDWFSLTSPNTVNTLGANDPREAADLSSADNSRGIGPFTDHAGNTYRVVLPQCDVLVNETTVTGWAYELLWKRDHQGGDGAMYEHGPYSKRWMRAVDGFPEYNPADESLAGTAADGRLPSDNSLPVADSADETFATSVNFYGAAWTRGAATGANFVVLRDGVPYLTEACVNFLVLAGVLYWVTAAGGWRQFQPGNGVVDLGLIDPRGTVVDAGLRVPPEVSLTTAAGTWTLSGVDVMLDEGGGAAKWQYGEATELLKWNDTIYAEAGDGWWRADYPTGWVFYGTTDPTEQAPPPAVTGAVQTTGSITATQNTLAVADITDFAVGDWIIGEIGHEAGAGMRGTVGVGGTWPSRSYSSEGAGQAALGATPAGTEFFWVNNPLSADHGKVFVGSPSGWLWMGDLSWAAVSQSGEYYAAMAVPRSLQAQIQSITPGAGTTGTFTLHNGPTDGVAAASASGMTVYRDEIIDINTLLAAGNLQLPAGDHIVGGSLHITDETNRILEGATSDRDDTRILSPRGVPCAQLDAHNSPGTIVRNLTFQGNWGDNGYGLNYGDGPAPHFGAARGTSPVYDSALPQGTQYTSGVRMASGSHNSQITNVHTVDCGGYHVGALGANAVATTDVLMSRTAPVRSYMGWDCHYAQVTSGTATRVTTDYDYITPAFEAFVASNVEFVDCGGTNAMAAWNGAVDCAFTNYNVTITANSLVETNMAANRNQPLFIANSLAGQGSGGTLTGSIIQQGFVKENFSMLAMRVTETVPGVIIENMTTDAPDYVPGAPNMGAMALYSAGPNLIVRNSTFGGKAAWTAQNNQENRAVLFVQNHNTAACVNLTLPDDPNSKFYF
jgi:hypothetical protein